MSKASKKPNRLSIFHLRSGTLIIDKRSKNWSLTCHGELVDYGHGSAVPRIRSYLNSRNIDKHRTSLLSKQLSTQSRESHPCFFFVQFAWEPEAPPTRLWKVAAPDSMYPRAKIAAIFSKNFPQQFFPYSKEAASIPRL